LAKRPSKNFEFPTGYNTLFSIDRFKIGEALFNPSFVQNQTGPPSSIPHLIQSSLNASDVELQTMLGTNVVLSGANSLLHGFADRVYSELHRMTQGVSLRFHH
jgi:hypothetical protein